VELSPADKVRLLRELTRGADDVFASRRDGAWGPVYGTLTDEIVARSGIAGLYTNTLFRYGRRLLKQLGPAVELGRSFVIGYRPHEHARS